MSGRVLFQERQRFFAYQGEDLGNLRHSRFGCKGNITMLLLGFGPVASTGWRRETGKFEIIRKTRRKLQNFICS
jgi:hypothetical protein